MSIAIGWICCVVLMILYIAYSALKVEFARLRFAALDLMTLLIATVRDPDMEGGIKLKCSSTPLANELRDKLAALEAACNAQGAEGEKHAKQG